MNIDAPSYESVSKKGQKHSFFPLLENHDSSSNQCLVPASLSDHGRNVYEAVSVVGFCWDVVDRCRKEKQLTPETAKNTTAQCNWSNPPVLSLASATGPIKEEPGTAELEKLEWSDEDCPRVTHRGVGGGTECLH